MTRSETFSCPHSDWPAGLPWAVGCPGLQREEGPLRARVLRPATLSMSTLFSRTEPTSLQARELSACQFQLFYFMFQGQVLSGKFSPPHLTPSLSKIDVQLTDFASF